MHPGLFCRPLSEQPVDVEVHLRPTAYTEVVEGTLIDTNIKRQPELIAELKSSPAGERMVAYRKMHRLKGLVYRPLAACTVQTFRNSQSGPMLYLFISYYQKMGWRVIVYDRFGAHHNEIKELLILPGVDYYPYTVFQLVHPAKYNKQYADAQGSEYKAFYKMEVNWGYKTKQIADTSDQDMDKSRTYDYARYVECMSV